MTAPLPLPDDPRRPQHFYCLVCRARREGAECEKCGNVCQLKPSWGGAP